MLIDKLLGLDFELLFVKLLDHGRSLFLSMMRPRGHVLSQQILSVHIALVELALATNRLMVADHVTRHVLSLH